MIKIFLFGTIGLLSALAVAFQSEAGECAATPTCVQLGYTMKAADCAGAKILRCPADPNAVYCEK